MEAGNDRLRQSAIIVAADVRVYGEHRTLSSPAATIYIFIFGKSYFNNEFELIFGPEITRGSPINKVLSPRLQNLIPSSTFAVEG